MLRRNILPTSTYLSICNKNGELLAAIADMHNIDILDEYKLETKDASLESTSNIIIDANLSEKCIMWFANHIFSGDFVADAVSTAKAPRLRPMLS